MILVWCLRDISIHLLQCIFLMSSKLHDCCFCRRLYTPLVACVHNCRAYIYTFSTQSINVLSFFYSNDLTCYQAYTFFFQELIEINYAVYELEYSKTASKNTFYCIYMRGSLFIYIIVHLYHNQFV